jgi:hypothetical protein
VVFRNFPQENEKNSRAMLISVKLISVALINVRFLLQEGNMKLSTCFERILVLLTVFTMFGCGSIAPVRSAGSSGMDLDTAVREAAGQMEANLPGQTKVALVSVASSSAQLSEYVISRLEAALVGGKKLVVVDRANLDKVREEQGFQLSGDVSDESAKAIGQLLGAGAIVTGAFTDLGDVYSLTLKAINMETAAVAVSYPADIAKSTRIETLLASGGGAAGGGTVRTQTAQAGNRGGGTAATQTGTADGGTAARAPAQRALPSPDGPFAVGDTGPAGGIIFYANPEAGEWKYLEAAPANTEKQTFFSSEEFPTDGIKNVRSIGSGKSNSEYIMRQAIDRGGGFDWAAEVCDALVVNGYDDWYLPSRDELHQMYGNLVRRGLGGLDSSFSAFSVRPAVLLFFS